MRSAWIHDLGEHQPDSDRFERAVLHSLSLRKADGHGRRLGLATVEFHGDCARMRWRVVDSVDSKGDSTPMASESDTRIVHDPGYAVALCDDDGAVDDSAPRFDFGYNPDDPLSPTAQAIIGALHFRHIGRSVEILLRDYNREDLISHIVDRMLKTTTIIVTKGNRVDFDCNLAHGFTQLAKGLNRAMQRGARPDEWMPVVRVPAIESPDDGDEPEPIVHWMTGRDPAGEPIPGALRVDIRQFATVHDMCGLIFDDGDWLHHADSKVILDILAGSDIRPVGTDVIKWVSAAIRTLPEPRRWDGLAFMIHRISEAVDSGAIKSLTTACRAMTANGNRGRMDTLGSCILRAMAADDSLIGILPFDMMRNLTLFEERNPNHVDESAIADALEIFSKSIDDADYHLRRISDADDIATTAEMLAALRRMRPMLDDVVSDWIHIRDSGEIHPFHIPSCIDGDAAMAFIRRLGTNGRRNFTYDVAAMIYAALTNRKGILERRTIGNLLAAASESHARGVGPDEFEDMLSRCHDEMATLADGDKDNLRSIVDALIPGWGRSSTMRNEANRRFMTSILLLRWIGSEDIDMPIDFLVERLMVEGADGDESN